RICINQNLSNRITLHLSGKNLHFSFYNIINHRYFIHFVINRVDESGNKLFAVEKILKRRIRDGGVQYLIKWKGYNKKNLKTWDELVENYDREQAKKRKTDVASKRKYPFHRKCKNDFQATDIIPFNKETDDRQTSSKNKILSGKNKKRAVRKKATDNTTGATVLEGKGDANINKSLHKLPSKSHISSENSEGLLVCFFEDVDDEGNSYFKVMR
ncbi:unnamed protein product, partial [Hymenolepis diminuta]|uniref:Chromo domain-containing protein n=1 Tax=Hymenolepis diminuta TaxID=6216 RepID=A0A0R3SRY7_HYMDI